MAKLMKIITIALAILFISLVTLYLFFENKTLLATAISLGTCFYHFIMRLIVGTSINAIYHNKMNYRRRWFHVSKLENGIYKILNFKKCKRIPTYSPDSFSSKLHSFEEILEASCQAEVVHEIIFVLSFLPIVFALLFGEFYVFLSTSIVASLIDLFFIMVQRSKRSTLIKFVIKHQKYI